MEHKLQETSLNTLVDVAQNTRSRPRGILVALTLCFLSACGSDEGLPEGASRNLRAPDGQELDGGGMPLPDYDGLWTGTTDRGVELTFEVRDNEVHDFAMNATFSFGGSNCSDETEQSEAAPIEDATAELSVFVANANLGLDIIIVFDDESSATGTIPAQTNGGLLCLSPASFSAGTERTVFSAVAFTAVKGPREPEPPPMQESNPSPVDEPEVRGVGTVGARCESDSDCELPLTCLTESGTGWLTGGPAAGYCTLDCSQDATACGNLTTRSMCVSGLDESEAYCMEACQPGSALPKCHSRPEALCADFGGVGACLPNCNSDADCTGGRTCDLSVGACTDAVRVGAPAGTPCDPVDPDFCEGECWEIDVDHFVCSSACTFGAMLPGGTAVCGIEPEAPTSEGAPVCLPLFENGAVGDLGLCLQRCDCDDHCLDPGSVCDPLLDPLLEEAFGALGLCVPESLAVVPPAPDAGRGLSCE